MPAKIFRNLRGDIYGGLTAAVVALPLALAFGVVSGVGALAGLYGAIAVGFFAAVFGGTSSQVSGPTGPMTVVMAATVSQYADNLPTAFTIVFLGGALQILFGILRIGRFVSYTPYSVVSGFMSGIGIIIILIQTLPFFGIATANGGPLGAISGWTSIPSQFNQGAVLVAAASLAVMIFWPSRWRTKLPEPLAALTVGTLLAATLFTGAPVIGAVPTGLPQFILPTFEVTQLVGIVQAAMILALLGSIDSLLTSLVADSITRTRHNSNKELIGQGIGNMVSGLIGGLPGAGATMRTVINVRAGGRTPLSGALHAIVLLALVLELGPLVEHVPHAALAGILLKVGWDIIDWGYLKRIRRAPREKVVVMLITLGLTVFVDLITAVAVGLILSSFVTAQWMEKEELRGVTKVALPDTPSPLSQAERAKLRTAGGRIELVLLHGQFSYASARELGQHINSGTSSSNRKAVILDFSEAAHIDTSAALAIEQLIDQFQDAGSACYIAGLKDPAQTTLSSLGVLEHLEASNILPDRAMAIDVACSKIDELSDSV